ncbi:hypothetical protein PQB86_gp086 [Klebsiella phage Miami]|uniref:Uncharacterized protein n=1 Tax=Klebsiella phage Miami TaxID=2767581 RepID=A0A873WND6_9CAUD|nr:hypothetical protein PQB86_gp086 [Klebsiella phage Miami]QPB09181.1 hypothetical protein CPT_Miami_086 [Klebsiella phage Miami]
MNINQLPENHHVISSMVNPFDANEELFFVTHARVNTYLDLDVWFCDMGTGDMRVVEPYGKVSDVRLHDYMERHVANNSDQFLYPTVIAPLSLQDTVLKVEGILGGDKLNPFPLSGSGADPMTGWYTDPHGVKRNIRKLPDIFDLLKDEQQENTHPLESTNTSKSLHRPSPEEISAGATKEYEARKAALKELLETGGEIKAIPKIVHYTKLVSYDEKAHIPTPRKGKLKKPNHNLNAIMGLLARTKK